MLYRIDEYIAEFPSRPTLELLRFKDCVKPLHEMTLDEVNKIVSSWKPVSPSTALYTARKINLYLDWLNEGAQFDARDIKFPIKNDEKEYIFSTDDISKYYNILAEAVERKATLNGTTAATEIFNMTHAAGILAFYGLSDKEILDLDYSDVQEDGVNGYDLPLTKDDINILMRYKRMTKYETNNNVLRGDKYIRNRLQSDKPTDSYFLNRPLSRVELEEEYAYLKPLLKTSSLNLYGKFNRVYLEEKKRGETIAARGIIPQWFKDIFNVGESWLTKRRKEYIEYRSARDTYKGNANDAVIAKINAINEQIEKLNKEAEELRKQMM